MCQHDRAFIRRLARWDLSQLLAHFDADPSMRYVGFPSSTSKLLATRLAPKYKLGALLAARSHTLRPGLALRPLIFWYDSNHLVEVSRALCIFEPHTHLPVWLRERLGRTGVARLRLRRGDFIEERLGTEQRALLVSLRTHPDECLRAFDAFGSYLLEERVGTAPAVGAELATAPVGGEQPTTLEADATPMETTVLDAAADGALCELIDAHGRATFIAHVDARGAAPRSWFRDLPLLYETQNTAEVHSHYTAM